MDFFTGWDRAVLLGLTFEEYKKIWESEMRKSEVEAEREMLKLRKENDHCQSVRQDQMIEYCQEKFQELHEEIAWLKKHVLETILRQSAMTNEKIDASMKHLEQCILEKRMKSDLYMTATSNTQQEIENNKNVASLHTDNMASIHSGNFPVFTNLHIHHGSLKETELSSANNVHEPHDELPVGAWPEQAHESPGVWAESVEEDVRLYYPTSFFQTEADTSVHDKTLEFGYSKNNGSEWLTVGHDGKFHKKEDDDRTLKDNERFAEQIFQKANGPYDEQISQIATGPYDEQISQIATGPYAEHISQMFLKNKSPIGNGVVSGQISSKFESHSEEFTIDNVKEFFKAKTTVETKYFWTLPMKFKYTMQFRFNKKNQLEVRIILSKCELGDIPVSPITISCVGKIYNPQSRRHTKLWTLDCHLMNGVHSEMELTPVVCLDTLRGSYSPVTYDTLAKRHYELHNRFDFLWTVTAQ